MEPLSPTDRRYPAARGDLWICLWVAALCAGLYFWNARQPASFLPGRQPVGHLFTREPDGYYGLLTAGFRSGHLYVQREPDPRLLALPDPYDPVANAPFRVHDMTLFGGKYYLYFGVTPALLFFWPIVAATGWYPTEPCAVAAFGLIGVVAGLALLCRLRRRHFPAAPTWSVALGGLCVAFANPVLVLTVQANFYQVPIACAFCLYFVMLLAVDAALHASRRPGAWMATASLLFGLTVGARPDYLFGGVLLLLPCAWLIRQAGGRWRAGAKGPPLSAAERRIRRRFLVATLGPAMACGAGLALYNWERFGSLSEFGMHYQLAGEDVRSLQLIRLDHIFVNGFAYLFGVGNWQRYFPFFAPATGQPYGFLRYAPWCLLMAWALGFGKRDGDRRPWLLAQVIAGGLAANLLLLSAYLGTTDRYPSDFLPAALLLGGFGAIVLLARVAPYPGRRRLLSLPVLVVGVFSVAVGLLVWAGRTPRSDVLLPLARLANGPTSRWERAQGMNYGDLRLEVVLPSGKEGLTEPLLETGSAPDRRDRVQATYLPDNAVQLSFFHAGIGVLEGHPIPIPADRHLTLDIRAGSLLPPFTHPVFASWTPEQYDTAGQEVRLTADGSDVLRMALACYPSPPQDVRIGRVEWLGDGVEGPFSGRIVAASRLPLAPPVSAPVFHAHRPIELEVLFPTDHPTGTEPLVVTGQGTRSDLLSCTYEATGRLHFTSDHFGYGGTRGQTVNYDPLHPHHLVIWMGSLAEGEEGAVASATVPWSRRIVVVMDGTPVFNEDSLFYPAPPETAQVGVNPFATTTSLAAFHGWILHAGQATGFAALPPLRRSGETGVLELQVAFPTDVPASAEPLVVTGVSGAGDMIYVRYLDGSHVSFGFDHWGTGGLTGAPVEMDYSQNHQLEITMDSLYPPGLSPRPFSGRVRVVLDGATVLDGFSPCYPTHLYEIRIGKNPLGSSTSGPTFTGLVVSESRRNPATLPSAQRWTGAGQIVMDTQFPSGLTGTAEPLAESGVPGAADLIYVRYVDDHHVRFGVDHWGTGGALSDPVEVDYGAPHRLELALDPFAPPGTAPTHRVMVKLDGVEAWSADVSTYAARPDQIHVAINSIGASSCRENYTGQILSLARPARLP